VAAGGRSRRGRAVGGAGGGGFPARLAGLCAAEFPWCFSVPGWLVLSVCVYGRVSPTQSCGGRKKPTSARLPGKKKQQGRARPPTRQRGKRDTGRGTAVWRGDGFGSQFGEGGGGPRTICSGGGLAAVCRTGPPIRVPQGEKNKKKRHNVLRQIGVVGWGGGGWGGQGYGEWSTGFFFGGFDFLRNAIQGRIVGHGKRGWGVFPLVGVPSRGSRGKEVSSRTGGREAPPQGRFGGDGSHGGPASLGWSNPGPAVTGVYSGYGRR